MNWKRWVVVIIASIGVAYLMFASGMFMHGDCVEFDAPPPC